MDKVLKYQYWASLILKERMGTISTAESKELADWVAADVRHKRLYDRVRQGDYAGDIKVRRRIDTELGLRKYNERHVAGKRRKLYRRISVAAAVVVMLGSGLLLFYQQEPVQKRGMEICPGTAKAELVLGDGSVRQLEKAGKEEIVFGETVIQNTGTEIEYVAGNDSLAGEQNAVSVYNELRIPTGGEYRLVMADGTKVWLNSQSRLRFPVSFQGGERTVYLEGEAYFEVAHDAGRPFNVKTIEGVRVQVLGTSFNVRAYSDEETIETVLEKGKVKMWRNAENVVLEPGVRTVYNRKDAKMSSMSVDTELYTAWREGHFIFQEETIERILWKLSRWYGMNVFFSDGKAKNILFSGNVRKYETINNLLEAMEISGGVHFEVNGNTIIVSACY